MQQGLSALRVVDLSIGIPGGYCCRLLADAGADVVKVEPPGGDPLARRGRPAVPTVDADEGGALFRFLHHGMRSVVGAPGDAEVDDLIATADVVIESYSPPSDACSTRTRWLVAHPGLVVLLDHAVRPHRARTPNGRPPSSSCRPSPAGSCARGSPRGVPFQAGGRTSEWLSGTFAGVAVAAAALRRAAHRATASTSTSRSAR